jgi:hypothetical protein
MTLPLAPSRPRLPDESNVDFADPQAVRAYMASLTAALTIALSQRAPIGSAIAGRLMVSPNGTTFEHTIDNAGNVVVTKKADPLP